ncbi:MAG: hypothetical protein J0H14_23740 [Alphaproteobacteria bacterium]|nr:hypothetical protein [Alphaproteobacteria bacterium]
MALGSLSALTKEQKNAFRDSTKASIKSALKGFLEKKIADPEAINYMLDVFDASFDLIMKAVEEGGVIHNSDVMIYFAQKVFLVHRYLQKIRKLHVSRPLSSWYWMVVPMSGFSKEGQSV